VLRLRDILPSLRPRRRAGVGLGDVQPSLYLSPAKPLFGWLIWGLGPSFSFATASDRSLGTGKNSAGLSTALLTIQGPWLVGVLITDVASIGGQEDRKNVHSFLMQPFFGLQHVARLVFCQLSHHHSELESDLGE
jgi:hypothetical protein